MFNVLQHLFTARALQRENAELKEQIAKVKAERDELKAQVSALHQKNENLSRKLEEATQYSGRLEPPAYED
jgi:uncharacterized coiled-coil DUF342 family protein